MNRDFEFRQLAGDSNALGKIKFNIPDNDDIYLHSTASPALFAKDAPCGAAPCNVPLFLI